MVTTKNGQCIDCFRDFEEWFRHGHHLVSCDMAGDFVEFLSAMRDKGWAMTPGCHECIDGNHLRLIDYYSVMYNSRHYEKQIWIADPFDNRSEDAVDYDQIRYFFSDGGEDFTLCDETEFMNGLSDMLGFPVKGEKETHDC